MVGGRRSPAVAGWAALTETEMRVARLISDGHTNKSAAAQLNVSANTVGTHLRSVFAKLDVRSRVQLTNLLNAREPAADAPGVAGTGPGPLRGLVEVIGADLAGQRPPSSAENAITAPNGR